MTLYICVSSRSECSGAYPHDFHSENQPRYVRRARSRMPERRYAARDDWIKQSPNGSLENEVALIAQLTDSQLEAIADCVFVWPSKIE